MNIYEKLLCVQTELKAPKSQFNKFGNYNYRNCEDILEAAKPILAKHKALVYLSDEITQIGERIYVKATALFVDTEKPESQIAATAYAREEESKKGMDGSQVTGASSSYARKYALNGLFDIDDNKDSDTTNDHGKGGNQPQANNKSSAPSQKPYKPKSPPPQQTTGLSKETGTEINRAISRYGKLTGEETKKIVQDLEVYAGKPMKDITEDDAQRILGALDAWTAEYNDMRDPNADLPWE